MQAPVVIDDDSDSDTDVPLAQLMQRRRLNHSTPGASAPLLERGGAAQPQPRLCGTFGCILEDCHPGLHIFGDCAGQRRQRKQPERFEAIPSQCRSVSDKEGAKEEQSEKNKKSKKKRPGMTPPSKKRLLALDTPPAIQSTARKLKVHVLAGGRRTTLTATINVSKYYQWEQLPLV